MKKQTDCGLSFVVKITVHQRLKGGTTAVVSLIRGNLLLTAWLGDSQAVLVRDGVATQLVNPHKPDRIVNIPQIQKSVTVTVMRNLIHPIF